MPKLQDLPPSLPYYSGSKKSVIDELKGYVNAQNKNVMNNSNKIYSFYSGMNKNIMTQ